MTADHSFTLADLRKAGPCEPGWKALLHGLGYATGKPDLSRRITIGDVAVINGAADAAWCLRLVADPRTRVRAIMPAVKRAAAHTTDGRAHDCIAAIERWADGGDSVDLNAAAEAARRAAWAARRAAWAAEGAARAATCAAAWAAEATEAEAAWAAAWAAEGAARAATCAAAWAAEATEAEAAWAAAWAAARAAWAAEERAAQVADFVALFGVTVEK